MNLVILTGRLVRDPELKTTDSGASVANFTIAVDREFASADHPEADFFDIVAWRQTAEFVSKYFKKGSKINLYGRGQIRPYTDKEGNKRRSYEVVADRVEFGESKKSSDNSEPDTYSESDNEGYTANDGGDGDLPF